MVHTKEQLETQILLSRLNVSNGQISFYAMQRSDVFVCLQINADIVITNGVIVAVDEHGLFEAAHEEDATGRFVIPA